MSLIRLIWQYWRKAGSLFVDLFLCRWLWQLKLGIWLLYNMAVRTCSRFSAQSVSQSSSGDGITSVINGFDKPYECSEIQWHFTIHQSINNQLLLDCTAQERLPVAARLKISHLHIPTVHKNITWSIDIWRWTFLHSSQRGFKHLQPWN